ncbi:macrofage activating glycoprotein [Moniliophthora roreri MCA 2997]|uniref:Macrofage activating glycoprotein n=1 Tax=Moniliophthora roreri (strain MCA 2997) TaxID=1381753 RepID=V2YW55_MONRO|nr:macrofage activating glycoprotein [Moniliophthora roreri MCA 2997]
MPFLKTSLLTVAFLAIQLVNAQTPHFKGELLMQPRLSNAKCLTAASNSDGAEVSIQTCTGADSQRWLFNDGSVKVFGNKCLDVTNGSTADGTKLQIWTCSNNRNPNQQFYYTGDLHLAWTNHGKCLDLTNGSTDDGNRPQLWSCDGGNTNQFWNVGYSANNLPQTSQDGQAGVNHCGTQSSQDSMCQTAWINSAEDFCVWAPPSPGTIGDTERIEVAYCTKSGRGTRLIPDGSLKGVHFVKTPHYVQVTGVGDFTSMNIPRGDDGGELDPHGADGLGNPIGGLVYGSGFGSNLQYHEWTNFVSYNEFCFRACVGANAPTLCQHIYDVMGCAWNMPANYNAGVFENCEGDDGEPMGVYGTSTWFQGQEPTPAAHPAPASSNCHILPTVGVTPARKKRDSNGFDMVKRAPSPSY